MGTYWDDFIETYGRQLLSRNFPLKTILEAFWYYAQATEEYRMMAYKIMVLDGEQETIMSQRLHIGSTKNEFYDRD